MQYGSNLVCFLGIPRLFSVFTFFLGGNFLCLGQVCTIQIGLALPDAPLMSLDFSLTLFDVFLEDLLPHLQVILFC